MLTIVEGLAKKYFLQFSICKSSHNALLRRVKAVKTRSSPYVFCRQNQDFQSILCYKRQERTFSDSCTPIFRQSRKRQRGHFPSFDTIPNLCAQSKLALKKGGFNRMTEIQYKTWEYALQGRDILARARTGTGKTWVSSFPFLLS